MRHDPLPSSSDDSESEAAYSSRESEEKPSRRRQSSSSQAFLYHNGKRRSRDKDEETDDSGSGSGEELGSDIDEEARKPARRPDSFAKTVLLGLLFFLVFGAILAGLLAWLDPSLISGLFGTSSATSSDGSSSILAPGSSSSSSSLSSSSGGSSPSESSSSSGSDSDPFSSASKTSSAGVVTITSTASAASGWVPVSKVRGVNLGSLFIVEPWMAGKAWSDMGCSAYKAEYQCVQALGVGKVQAAFENHWNTFYNESDFTAMAALGLNAIRIPLGYWTVDAQIMGDPFVPGSWKYVKQICGWAKAAGLYILLDLHGVPGSQVVDQPFGGYYTDNPSFFGNTTNFQRAAAVLANWTTEVHTNDVFSTVVAIEVVNEPRQGDSSKNEGLIDQYYPMAQKAIRDAETALGVKCEDTSYSCLGIVFMNTYWGSGNPTTNLAGTDHVLFDDHDYDQWISPDTSPSGLMSYACSDVRAKSQSPMWTGEWSLAGGSGSASWFMQWSQAQIVAHELGAGWFFWAWKGQSGNTQWSYQDSVNAGYIPSDLSKLDTSPCG